MKWRSGFLRIWVALSIVWLPLSLFVLSPDILSSPKRFYSSFVGVPYMAVPVLEDRIELLRTETGWKATYGPIVYEITGPSEPSEDAWNQVMSTLKAEIEKSIVERSHNVQKDRFALMISIGFPLAIFAAGWSIAWIAKGFRGF